MYWLVGILVIVAMIGTLSVAEHMVLPASSLLESMASTSIWPLLIITSIVLWFLNQRHILNTTSSNASLNNKSRAYTLSISTTRYLLTTILVSIIIIGSALQALLSYQQAEATQITEPMRVQAWVTIEGISDSVYAATTDSGYRQVATLQDISPLVTELSTQDLDAKMLSYSKNIGLMDDITDSDIENIQTLQSTKPAQSSGYRVLLNAYPKGADNNNLASLNRLPPGSQLLMTLSLAPLTSSQEAINNPSGFDSYRWLRSRHIDGIATIITVGTPIDKMGDTLIPAAIANPHSDSSFRRLRVYIDQWRWQLRQYFYQDWQAQTTAKQQAKAVTLSLLTGDRSLINRDTKDLYQLAGISHLLAISGTHVLFLAIILAGAATLLVDRLHPRLYRFMPRWQVRWWVMIGAAFIYALFTGFDVPAARTAWMLLALGMVRLTLLPISTMRVLLAMAVLMAWFDGYVLWQAGFWLSFIAVALLLKYDESLHSQSSQSVKPASLNTTERSSTKRRYLQFAALFWLPLKRLFKLQFWLFIALLPVTLLLFGKASLWGLVINLFAIGLFGWVIVPLNLLAGLCYLVLPAVFADSIWALVSAIVGGLHELIMWLTSRPALSEAWLYTPVNVAILLMVLLAILPWLLPRGLLSRWLVLPPLTLLMMTVYANQQTIARTPTLYLLPTNDDYLSAALLQYPLADKGYVSWLFLADHRPSDRSTMPSSLSVDKLSASLKEQLGVLSVKRLEGAVVQTSMPMLTSGLSDKKNRSRNAKTDNNSELLPMTVKQLSLGLPISRYWQAGRHQRLSSAFASNRSYLADARLNKEIRVSAQDCGQGKTWQLANSDLRLQVLTGWREIDDASVWDCAIAIDSVQPIQVLQYNAANPRQSPSLTVQKVISKSNQQTAETQVLDRSPVGLSQKAQQNTPQNRTFQSRIILDAATHPRSWQMWSLLCTAKPFAIDITAGGEVTWMTHSASQLSADAIRGQQVDKIMSYNNQPLVAALALKPDS